MTGSITEQESPYLYECMVCDHRLEAHGPAVCPNCTEEMKNLSKPSANPGLRGPSY